VIDGSVTADASSADVAVNEATVFCVTELVHHQYQCDPNSGRELGRLSMIEFGVTQGTPPEKWSKFQGIGMLTANTPPQPQGMGTVRREYRFNIYAETVAEAWEKFESFNERGAKQAEDSFRREFTEWQQAKASQLALVGGGQPGGLIDPSGRPLG
jgi:hypothetical protein